MKTLSKQHKQRISESCKGVKKQGHPAWNKGKRLSKAARKKMSLAAKIRKRHPHSEEAKRKMSLAAMGNKNHYIHGKGYAGYLRVFIRVREQVRARDNWKCQKCGIPQEELETTLHVHHIDLDKANNSYNNLVTVCSKCHGQLHCSKRKQETCCN